jgi:hypothetical protein
MFYLFLISGVDAPTPSHREESEAVRPRGNKVYILGHILSGPMIKINPLFLIWSLKVSKSQKQFFLNSIAQKVTKNF